MKRFSSKIIVVGIFFAAVTLLAAYLLTVRWHINSPVVLFWVAVALMIGIITFQILRMNLPPSHVKIILLEIVVTAFLFHMIYQIPYYGLDGFDPYQDMISAKGILSSGFVLRDTRFVNQNSYFPMIHIFGATLSNISGIDLFSVAKWFPSFVDVILVPLFYLLLRTIFKEEKVALLSALLFTCLQNHISFSSDFVRETIALVLAVCCLYLYFSRKDSRHPVIIYGLAIICLVGTVFAHHLTSFMLLVFLTTHFLVYRIAEVPFLRRTYFGDNIKGEKVTVTFLSIAFGITIAYWTFVASYPLYTLATFIRSIFTSGQAQSYADLSGINPTSIMSIRGNIIFYGFFLFTFIFAGILLYKLLPNAKNSRVETYSFTLFLFICGLVGFVSLYLIPAAVFPDRFLAYGWLFGFPPLVAAILKGKHKWLKKAGVFLLIAFMLFNIYQIDPTQWDASAAGYPASPSLENYALAKTFNFSGGTIFGDQDTVEAIFDVQNQLGGVLTSYYEVNITQYNWIIINKKVLELEISYYPQPRTETIALLEHLAFENPTDYSKIYESDNLVVMFRLPS